MVEQSLLQDQKFFLQIIFDCLLLNYDWPTFHDVDLKLLENDIDIEFVIETFNSNNRDIFFLSSPNSQDTEKLVLRLNALRLCLNSDDILLSFVIAIQFCAQTCYAKAKGHQDLTINSSDLGTIIKHEHIEIVGRLMRDNCNFFNGFSFKEIEFSQFLERFSYPWVATFNRGIYKYRQIKTLDDFLSTRDAKPTNTSTFNVAELLYPDINLIRTGGHEEKVSNPPIPYEIVGSLQKFKSEHSDPLKAAFMMMRFSTSRAHSEISNAIKGVLKSYGLEGLRADDKEYHPDLFSNILTYLHGCGFGIALFERIEVEEHNPNVALEVGYMFALGKPVCLLKDQTLKAPPVDLIGKLYRPFNVQDISASIESALAKWLTDQSFIELP